MSLYKEWLKVTVCIRKWFADLLVDLLNQEEYSTIFWTVFIPENNLGQSHCVKGRQRQTTLLL